MHIGSARTALFNWLFARRHGGTFILRIEDTDRVRSTKEFLESIMEDMKWLGLDWDEGPEKGGDSGPYYQMERLNYYDEYARKLVDKGIAYDCYCMPEELEERRKKAISEGKKPGYDGRCRSLTTEELGRFKKDGRPSALRFKVTPGQTQVNDLIRGNVIFNHEEIDDFVIMKSGGIPVYNFAAVVDDYMMKITHIIRGEEHLSNTPRQIMMYGALGLPLPQFAHIPIILNEDRSKLSKRRGASNLGDFRDKGYLPSALLNFLALLGWSPGGDREIMTVDEIIKEYSLEGVTAHPAVFDEKKLEWMNSQYVKMFGKEKLAEFSLPFFLKAGYAKEQLGRNNGKWFEDLCELHMERIRTIPQFAEESAYFFHNDLTYDEGPVKKYLKHEYVPEVFEELARRLEALVDFTIEKIEETVRKLAEERGLAAAKIIHPVRVVLTGKQVSPGLFQVMNLLGKEQVIKRLKKGIIFLRGA
ncbi:MAG: glutamate--tRNA ligase [Firmicutes bacterium]|nr:glutamate--tRNA ligase [Bacillota bacterium]